MASLGTNPTQLARKGGPAISAAAAATVNTSKMEGIVLSVIHNHGSNGATSDEVLASLPGHRYSTVTARYASLLRKDLIEINGTRPGNSNRQQQVMVSKVTANQLNGLMSGGTI